MLVGGILTTSACGKSDAPSAPSDADVGRLDVVVDMPFTVVGRDSTSHQWQFTWGTEISGMNNVNRSPATPRAQVLSGLPTPVRVTDISSVFRGPDGQILQTNSTSTEQLQGRVGGNEVTSTNIFPIFYDGFFIFPSALSSSTQSDVVTTVRLVDGSNQRHEVTKTTMVIYELPPPSPCSPTRDRPTIPEVRITSSGPQPVSQRAFRAHCVTFVNADSVAHDIRSDPHPDHSACPELNVDLISPGDRRTTSSLRTFGTCNYHDDRRLNDQQFRGSVLIE